MIKTIEDFYTQAEKYAKLFNIFMEKHDVAIIADHICYKCGTTESFNELRTLFESCSSYIYQSIISHRRIAYIKLNVGIKNNIEPIYFLELSDQKIDASQQEGFDHIEIYSRINSYKNMIETLRNNERLIEKKRPHHTTHDITLADGFIIRCTHEPLIEKIKREEMT